MSPIFFRRTAGRIIQNLGVEQVTEMIGDAALEAARKIRDSKLPEEFGKVIGQKFISNCAKSKGTTTRTSPWILSPPIYERRDGFAFLTYSPSKGEILSLFKHKKKKRSEEGSPAVGSIPWLMVPPAFDAGSDDAVYKLYPPSPSKGGGGGGEVSLTTINRQEEAEAKLVGSSHGWLASYNDRTCDLFLWNPRTGRRIRLPPVPQEGTPAKVIISCSPDDDHDNCIALMSFGHNRLAFCCPGKEEEEEWTPIGARQEEHFGLRCVRSYDDFVYSGTQKRFFAVLEGASNVVECWDLQDPQSPKLDWQSESSQKDLSKEEEVEVELPDKDWCRQVKYLVSADQQLFLITRYVMEDRDKEEDSRTIGFDVHRIEGRKLQRMNNSLDGLVMFVGINHSFAVEPSGQFKPNSIYFTHHNDIGIFDYKNATCSYNLQRFKRIQPPPFWFYCR